MSRKNVRKNFELNVQIYYMDTYRYSYNIRLACVEKDALFLIRSTERKKNRLKNNIARL